jgi:hypothetical protein
LVIVSFGDGIADRLCDLRYGGIAEGGKAACIADVLAGKATREDVDLFEGVPVDCRDVVMNGDAWPVLAQDRLAVRVALDKPSRAKGACLF